MRNSLASIAVIVAVAFAAGCVAEETATRERESTMGIEVTLSTAASPTLAQVDPASPAYDPVAVPVDLVFANRGSSGVSFPGEGVTRRVVRTYQNLETRAVQTFVVNEPPVATADLVQLAPGETWTYRLGFELPTEILTNTGRAWPIRICVAWDKAELDLTLFPDGSYDWAESFKVCKDIVLQG
jgi:hypothetical protein